MSSGWDLTTAQIDKLKAAALYAMAPATSGGSYYIQTSSPAKWDTAFPNLSDSVTFTLGHPPQHVTVQPPAPEPVPEPVPAPVLTPPAEVGIDGTAVPICTVLHAIAVLEQATGAGVREPLQRHGNMIAGLNLTPLLLRECAWSALGKTTQRLAALAALRRLVDPLRRGPFTVNPATGYLLPVLPLDGGNRLGIAAIAAAVGHGRIVGRGHSRMSDTVANAWATAWHNGDLARCYELEATVSKAPSPFHPGAPDNPDTHRVVWDAAVAGEIPAGATIPGDWPSPNAQWPREHVENYLLAARCAHPRFMTSNEARNWVKGHLRGAKFDVDTRSAAAKRRATTGFDVYSSPPRHRVLPPQPTWQVQQGNLTPVTLWNTGALRGYLDEHGQPGDGTWPDLVARVETHQAAAATAAAAEATKLVLHYAPDQPQLSGFHRKAVLVDQHGQRWLFKPAPCAATRFRADTEHEAHQLARAWGFPTAESRLVEFDGHHGQIQAMHDAARNLLGVTGAGFAALTTDQLRAIACEHVLDWGLDNDDCHGENIIITTDGAAIGIDKGRAWRYFGGWPGITGDTRANTNCQLIYTRLYQAIADGHLPRDQVDGMYRAVLATARRMRLLPDATLAEHISRAVEHRPHYQPSSYQTPVDDAPTSAAELVAAATARKGRLVDDMTALWAGIYTRAGWEPPDLTGTVDTNQQGYRIYTGLLDPDLPAAVAGTANFGTATFVAGTDVEDAHLLLWREIRPDGTVVVRGTGKLRAAAVDTMEHWCRSRHDPVVADRPEFLDNEHHWYLTIIQAAKTVSYHHADKQYNQYKMNDLTFVERALTRQLQLQLGRTGALALETRRMCRLYLDYIASIYAHRDAGTCSADGDYPRFVLTWPPPQPADPAQPTVVLTAATRAAADLGNLIRLRPDGQLQLNGSVLYDDGDIAYGQPGNMYLITLPTGEQIEFRGTGTDTHLSTVGLVQFTIDNPDVTAGLTRIDALLTGIGIDLRPADAVDLELFYWRHLVGIFRDRADTLPGTGRDHYGHPTVERYAPFWAHLNQHLTTDRADELIVLRTAFGLLSSPGQIAGFVAAGGHLPRFGHPDLRQPAVPAGHPYWTRFDVTREQWTTKQMPTISYRNAAKYPALTGQCLSTEDRIRTYAIFKAGQSSYADMMRGSAGYVFTRQNMELGCHQPHVYLRPEVLTRTHNYAFGEDQYGRIDYRRQGAFWDFTSATAAEGGSNELLIKHGLTLLDDIEILVFADYPAYSQAVDRLRGLGITSIRGIAVTTRFVVNGDQAALNAARRSIRASYQS